MTPEEVLQAIVRALKDSTKFSGGSYITHEMDAEGADNRLDQPVVALNVEDNPRATDWDSDLVGTYDADGDGLPDGRVFRPTWEMEVDAFVIIAAGNDNLNASVLGGEFQQALLDYDSQMFSKAFPDGSGGVVEEIESFTVGDGQRQDNLGGPGLRQWQQSLSVTWYHEIRTDDPIIDNIEVAQTDEMTEDSDGMLVWNY